MPIFKNQTGIKFKLRTSINFNVDTIQSQKIRYVKPDESTGEWDALVLAGSETTGIIYVLFTDLLKCDQSGKWDFQAYIVYSDDTDGYGEIVTVWVEEPIEVEEE